MWRRRGAAGGEDKGGVEVDFEIKGGEIGAGVGGRRVKFGSPSVGSRHSVKLLLFCRVLDK
jgi:hypothetical protein